MLEERWHEDRRLQPRPACPYFRLLSDPEAQAISLGDQRFCNMIQQPLADLGWQASYCMGAFDCCPHLHTRQGAGEGHPSRQLLELLAAQRTDENQQRTRRSRSSTATVPFATASERATSAGTLRIALRERLVDIMRRPLVVAVTTVALIGGLWAGIALADTLSGNRPSAEAGQPATTSAPAFTLRTSRPTPTPTPFPAPAQGPGLPSLSVSRASTATPTPAPRPAKTVEPTATPIASPEPSPTPQPVVAPQPAPKPDVVWPTVTPNPSSAIEIGTPTPTAVPWPSITPTPTVTPTPTPSPTPTPIPTPTPDPWANLPPMARVGQPVPVTSVGNLLTTLTPYPFAGNALAGTAPATGLPDVMLPANAGILHGLQSGANSGRIWLNTPEPIQRLVLVVEGMSNTGPLAPVLRISINGITLWEGVSPFPHGDWSTVAWVIDKPQILTTSQLQITLSLATPGETGEEPWVALASVTVYAE